MLHLHDQPFPHVRHHVAGRPTTQEIALALNYTLQHDEIPILWDLTELDCDEATWIRAREVASTIVDPRRSQMSSSKRAFVVADEAAHAGMEMVLERLSVPWQWAIFRDIDEALRWLEG